MAKKKTEVKMISYGRYTKWDKSDKNLPKLKQVTDVIPAEPDEEFGFILEFRKGKGRKIDFLISHPPIKDDNGDYLPDFTGEYFIKANNYQFFIGDCVWDPVEDKIGKWVVKVWLDGDLIGEKEFRVVKTETNQ